MTIRSIPATQMLRTSRERSSRPLTAMVATLVLFTYLGLWTERVISRAQSSSEAATATLTELFLSATGPARAGETSVITTATAFQAKTVAGTAGAGTGTGAVASGIATGAATLAHGGDAPEPGGVMTGGTVVGTTVAATAATEAITAAEDTPAVVMVEVAPTAEAVDTVVEGAATEWVAATEAPATAETLGFTAQVTTGITTDSVDGLAVNAGTTGGTNTGDASASITLSSEDAEEAGEGVGVASEAMTATAGTGGSNELQRGVSSEMGAGQ